MNNNFFVCDARELKGLLDRESKNFSVNPKIYFAGYTMQSVWLDEDNIPEDDLSDIYCYCVDYSDDGEDAVFDKFFDYLAVEAVERRNYMELAIGGDSDYIDVFYSEEEYYSLYDFWHTNELSKEDIECLNDLAA